jgi:hypoxanthine-DNA glycosylase
MDRSHAFAPVADAGARVLILGSLPGVASLAREQYYAHPRNDFWRLVGAVIRVDLPALPYDGRLAALTKAGIALWDVVASAERRGSLDAAIRNPAHADLAALVAALPALRAVAFNGRTAATLGRRQLTSPARGPLLIDLPSSSPAHAAMTFEAKRQRWSALARYL